MWLVPCEMQWGKSPASKCRAPPSKVGHCKWSQPIWSPNTDPYGLISFQDNRDCGKGLDSCLPTNLSCTHVGPWSAQSCLGFSYSPTSIKWTALKLNVQFGVRAICDESAVLFRSPPEVYSFLLYMMAECCMRQARFYNPGARRLSFDVETAHSYHLAPKFSK